MKKILVAMAISFTIASAEGYTQADRILDMQKMAQAMQDIQSGFFYNNVDIIKAGTKELQDTIIKVRPIDAEENTKDIYEKWMNNNLKMTHKIQKKIRKKSETLYARFKDGDAVQALQEYSKIASQCMKCHTRLRKW